MHVTALVSFFADLGLGLLFFFAGYEIDLQRISGPPLRLGLAGWAISLAIAYGFGGLLAALGIVLSLLYTGSALATTAIGTLIPILSDTGELRTRFGTYLLGAGAVGEFGPILLLTLILSTAEHGPQRRDPGRVRGPDGRRGRLRGRSAGRTLPLFERTLESSSSWPSAGSWCWSSRSRCWPTTWGSTCCSAASRPASSCAKYSRPVSCRPSTPS